ncbi:MAG: glycosyltransferase family 2 protein [Chloroflexi bacterium]|nr:glycosyltransferase family 2 protein [Chloroflexota bacterium]
MDLSVIIVSYNVANFLRGCLASIYRSAPQISFEVLVVDNASTDGSAQMVREEFPQAIFLANESNYGFARANNQALRMSKGRYCLLLNPDTLLNLSSLDEMVEFMDHRPDAGASGCQLISPDGAIQASCRMFPTMLAVLLRGTPLHKVYNKPVARYLMADWDHSDAREVDWVLGACLLLRREALEDVGLLDEGFFLYYEDIDLCYRLKVRGWKVYYNPQIQVVHYYQRASAQGIPNRLTLEHIKSISYLFRKHPLPLV